ncbi:unnamed protein product [Cyprideis torosa]|uniref:Angiotensin-converting enzyme n=1 Tax=Cyprideis torosa TaxID=163714 RepID=A0A7R8WE46_9CRUS|nr:unnamed protein product [Cyprideis torosa]CAG0892458.1 unnamed protein product [Cyprideis torosa]
MMNEVLKRKLWMIKVIGSAALSEEKFNHVAIKDELEQKTDYDELAYYWKAWRDATGARMRDLYLDNLKLLKEIAAANGMDDVGQIWRRRYEDETFLDQVEMAWQSLKPFYQELHAYVRHKLLKVYPTHPDLTRGGLIPAHLLGNMWAQSWSRKFKFLKITDETGVNLDKALKKKYKSVVEFFTEADKFFQDVGLDPLPPEFYENSMLVKPPEREVQCHPNAWNIDPPDVRVKMCTKFKFNHFNIVHHELGHIQYFLLAANQSRFFRGGANPGFHEAVGDLMSLSVNTRTHLESLGLYEKPPNFNQTASDLNFLLGQALHKNMCMVQENMCMVQENMCMVQENMCMVQENMCMVQENMCMVQEIRWMLFEGKIPEDQLNSAWWKLKQEYQGIKAPVTRSEADFDAGSKFHIASNVPYIRYFVAVVLQYSFHKELCVLGGQYDEHNPTSQPLHLCDISAGNNTKRVGQMLRKVLSLGSSKPPQDVLEIITGRRNISTDAMLEYFKPLRRAIQSAQSSPFSDILKRTTSQSAGKATTLLSLTMGGQTDEQEKPWAVRELKLFSACLELI